MTVPGAALSGNGAKPSPHYFIAPKGAPQAFIAPEFRKAILLHVTKNNLTVLKPALILAVQGKAGEGKSFQVREACSQAGVNLVHLSGSSLSGTYEGESISAFEGAYCFASALRESSGKMTALVVDDFDLSVAAMIDDRRYTVNTQLLTGFLMNLADDPWRCGDRATSRVPIIFTGNNFRSLHGPLTRNGRMNFFEWTPSIDQKIEIVRYMFSGVLLKADLSRVAKLVNRFSDKPISFFSALKDDLVDDAIYEVIETGPLTMQSFEEAAAEALNGQTLERLIQLAHTRERRLAGDFLRGST